MPASKAIIANGRAINGHVNIIQNFSAMDAVKNLRFEIKQCEESDANGKWLIQASSYSGPDQTMH